MFNFTAIYIFKSVSSCCISLSTSPENS